MEHDPQVALQKAWLKYQEKVRILEARRREVLAREDVRLTNTELFAIRSRLGLPA